MAAKKIPALNLKPGHTEVDGLQMEAFSTKGTQKANAGVTTLPLSKIHVEKDFNPRNDTGDVSELEKAYRHGDSLPPLEVRPSLEQDGKFSIVRGHRRFKAAKSAGVENLPVVIRFDLVDRHEARAAAVADNVEDGRVNLNYIEMGTVFKELEKAKWTAAQIASKCGVHERTVRRALEIMDAPEDVQKRVVKGELSATSALEYARLDEKQRKAIQDKLEAGISAKEVRALGKRAAKEAGAVSTSDRANAKKGSARDAAIVAWRGSKEKTAELMYLCDALLTAKAGGEDPTKDTDLLRATGSVRALLWDRGDVDALLMNDPERLPKDAVTKADKEKYVKDAEKESAHFWKLVESWAAKYAAKTNQEPPVSKAATEEKGDGKAKKIKVKVKVQDNKEEAATAAA